MRTRFNLQVIKLALFSLTLGTAVVAQAALFEDDEARRAILDLRQKLDVTQQGLKSQADDIAVLRRALFELQNQIEALKAEQSALRGANEQLLRELAEMQRLSRRLIPAGTTLDRAIKLAPDSAARIGQRALTS